MQKNWVLAIGICFTIGILSLGFTINGCGQQQAETTTSTSSSTSSSTSTTSTTIVSITVSQEVFTSEKAQTVEVSVTVGGTTQVVTQEVVSDVIIVNAASGIDETALNSQLSILGYTIVGKNSETNTYQVSLPAGKTLSTAISDLSSASAVKNAGTDPVIRKEMTVPNEAVFSDIFKVWAFDQLDMKKVWDLTTGEATIKIAVVDTGINVDHPEFQDRLVHKQNFVAGTLDPSDDDADSHGTAVAGIIGARGNNSRFMAGMNWSSQLMPLKVLSSKGDGSSFSTANAICYAAAAGAKVINVSSGGWYNSWTNSSIIEQYQKAAQTCEDYGALLICSAGNDNSDTAGTLSTHYPGGGLKDYSNIIAVAAIDSAGDLTSFTNYGSGVTIAAPGQSIYSTLKETVGDTLDEQSGTSFAAPFVTGLASLIWSINPSLTAAGVKTCIIDGAEDISWEKNVGKKINVWNSIRKALELKNYGIIAVNSNPSGSSIYIDDTDKGRITTSEGYTYFAVAEGSHTVKATKSGYTTSQETVSVTKGAVTYSDLTLGGAEAGNMISGDTSSYLKIDNGNFWIRTDYTSSSTRNILNQISLSSSTSNWLNRALYQSPCITQADPFWKGVKDRSLTILKNTSSLAAYKVQFTVTSESKALRVSWKFIVPKDKKYAIWVASFESVGTDKNITVDNPSSYGVRDIYFCYPIQPTPETSTYVTWEGISSAVPWSYVSADIDYSSARRFFSIYNSNGCFTFGYFGSSCSTAPYSLLYLNSEMGYRSVFTTVTKVTLTAFSPTTQWIGVLAFHSNVADAGSLFSEAQSNLSTYLSAIQ